MKFSLEQRTYELRNGEWIECRERRQRPSLRRLGATAATTLAIAAFAAIGIVAAGLALILLPIAWIAAWLSRTRRTP